MLIIKLLLLFWTFFKIGLFTIGGGYAMIPMIESEVISRGWLTETELFNFLAISESTPGPFAINMATFVGVNEAGIIGGIFTTLGVITPSIIIIILIFKVYEKCYAASYGLCGPDRKSTVIPTEAIGSSITFFIHFKKDCDSEVCPVKILFRNEEKQRHSQMEEDSAFFDSRLILKEERTTERINRK